MTFGQNSQFGVQIPKEWMRKYYLKFLNWIPTGRRERGRPEAGWIEGALRTMEECGLRDRDWE